MKYKVDIKFCDHDVEAIKENENILAQALNREPRQAIDVIKDNVLSTIRNKAEAKQIEITSEITFESNWEECEQTEECEAKQKLHIECHFEGVPVTEEESE